MITNSVLIGSDKTAHQGMSVLFRMSRFSLTLVRAELLWRYIRLNFSIYTPKVSDIYYFYVAPILS
jgi:hypothetical protein